MTGYTSTVSSGIRAVSVRKRDGAEVSDFVAVEAPLEIRVGGRPLVITMRTPGHDEELAAGFLYAEGVLTRGDQIVSIRTEPGSGVSDPEQLAAGKVGSGDRVLVELRGAPDPGAVQRAQRDFRATAACGVCGKESLEDLDQALPRIARVECATDLLDSLPERMRPHQTFFEATGDDVRRPRHDEQRGQCAAGLVGRRAISMDILEFRARVLAIHGKGW